MLDLIIKAETEGLDTEDEVIEYARVILDTGLYRSAGRYGRFLRDLAESDIVLPDDLEGALRGS